MDWGDLRFVLALGREGSLVGAARRLGVEHTTVRRRIDALERELGARLFAKTPEGHVATPAGLRAIAAAEVVEREVLGLEAAVGGEDGGAEGVVRVTTSEAFFGVVVAHLPELYARHPRIRVELLSGNRVFDLTRGEADVALRLAATPQPELVVQRVGEAGWALFASQCYLDTYGTPTQLAGHRVVGFDDPLTRSPGAEWLAKQDDVEVVMRANSIPSVAAAVATGLAVSCLPVLMAPRDPRLIQVSDVVTSGQVWLVAHPDRLAMARVRLVWDFLKDVVQRERGLIGGRDDA